MNKNIKLSRYRITKIRKCFCIDIPASKTALLLGINRNTVNKHFMYFRHAICYHQSMQLQKLTGEVELDESYFGAKRVRGNKVKLKRGRGTLKQPVFGVFERDGRVYTEIVPDCTKATLQAIILGKVSLDTVIHTDGWRSYDGLVDVGYDKHYRVNHGANEFSRGNGKHINGMESFWSFAKRRLAKFNGVKVNFVLHLKECEWRWHKTFTDLENELVLIVKQYEKWLNS